MPDLKTIHRLIDQAIQANTSIYIRYRDFHGNISEREISPREWVEPEKIVAFCHLRNEERNFKTYNITAISKHPFATVRQFEQAPAAPPQIEPVYSRQVPRPNPGQRPLPGEPKFTRLTSADQWHNLMAYYRGCLGHEYQQQFSMGKEAIHLLGLDDQVVYEFLSAKHHLTLKPGRQDALRSFLDGSRRRNQQLCLGKSFVCIRADKISPLLFVPLTVGAGFNDVFLLTPEEYDLSYAALMNLGFDENDIASFLDDYHAFCENQPGIEAIEKFILQALSERLSRPLPVFSHEDYSLATISDYSIYDGAGLFWVNNEFTGNLIFELDELSDRARWQTAPAIIRHLFDTLPEHTHAPAPDFIEDQRFYVTNINAQQRKAAQAVADHPVTIVTGPPGTGKSQLVLNLIAQAYLAGKKVLFASHNNKAVDVVMDRLQGETRFQGAIRTGSKPNRKKAVEQMESAIAQVYQPVMKDFEASYQDGKRKLKQATDQLDLVRDLQGKIQSYQAEKLEILERLSAPQKERFQHLDLPFIEEDKIRLNGFLTSSADQFRALIDQRHGMDSQLRERLRDRAGQEAALLLLREYESQWGRFANGLLHQDGLPSLAALSGHCRVWINTLACISAKKNYQQAQQDLWAIKKKIDRQFECLSDEQGAAALLLEALPEADFDALKRWLAELRGDFEQFQALRYAWVKKIAVQLGILNPKAKMAAALSEKASGVGLKSGQLDKKRATVQELQAAIAAFQSVVETGGLLRQSRRQQQVEAQAKEAFRDDRAIAHSCFLPLALNRFENASQKIVAIVSRPILKAF